MANGVNTELSFFRVIRMNVSLLKLFGLIEPENKTFLKMVLSYCSTFMTGFFLVIQTYSYGNDLLIHTACIKSAIESFGAMLAFLGVLVRFLIIYWSRGRVHELLNTLDDLWKLLSFQERHYVTLSMKDTKNLTYLCLSQCIFTIICYIISSLFINSTNGNVNATRSVPFGILGEFHQSPYYEIIYFLQVYGIINITLAAMSIDMMGPVLITAACGHLRVIQEKLISIDRSVTIRGSEMTDKSLSQVRRQHQATNTSDNDNPDVGKNHLELVSCELKYCVNYHRKILAICTDIERITNMVFLVLLITITFNLSAVGFKLIVNDKDQYKYSLQIIIGLVELLICNWPPDLLITELPFFQQVGYYAIICKNLWLWKSQAVADAAYFMPWYEWPSELRKSVFIIILQAQKPIQLTAGKCKYLSLETFSSLVSSAVSFFTFFRSFN